MKESKDGSTVVFDIWSDKVEIFLANYDRLKQTQSSRVDFVVSKCKKLPELQDDEDGYGGAVWGSWRDQGGSTSGFTKKPAAPSFGFRGGEENGFERPGTSSRGGRGGQKGPPTFSRGGERKEPKKEEFAFRRGENQNKDEKSGAYVPKSKFGPPAGSAPLIGEKEKPKGGSASVYVSNID